MVESPHESCVLQPGERREQHKDRPRVALTISLLADRSLARACAVFSVWRRPFDAIDHEHLNRSPSRLELEPELLA